MSDAEAMATLLKALDDVSKRLDDIEGKCALVKKKPVLPSPGIIFLAGLIGVAFIICFLVYVWIFGNPNKTLSLNMDLLQGIGAMMTGIGALWAAIVYAHKNSTSDPNEKKWRARIGDGV